MTFLGELHDMQRLTLFTSLSFGLGASLCASAAFAQDDCSSSADCEVGFVCGVIGSSGCAAEPCPDDGSDCKPVDCAPEEFYGCVAAPCESDADCGTDMVCQTEEWGSCSGAPPCDADGNCEPAPEPACETGTTSQCVYKWDTSCEADADCGEGFTCEQAEAGCDCASSGGGSDPAVPEEGDDGGEADFAPPAEDPPQGELPLPPEEEPTDCGCGEPEIFTYCAAEEISCESNDDCPSSWTCEAIYERDCGDVAGSDDDSTDNAEERPAMAGDPLPPADDEGEPPPDEGDPKPSMDGGVDEDPLPEPCEPVVSAQMCVPPGGSIGRGDDEGGVATGADGEGKGDVPLQDDPAVEDDGAEEPSTDDETDDDGVGSADDEDDATDDEDDATDDEDNNAGDDDEADDEADDDGSEKSGVKNDGGDDDSCSVAQTGSGSGNGAWLALLLGLPLILRRRNK